MFAYHVNDPERYGVVEFDASGRVLDARGKAGAAEIQLRRHRALLLRCGRGRAGAGLKPSARGELEITDLNRLYLERGDAVGRTHWAAALPGSIPARTTRCSMRGQFVATLEKRQGFKIACPEEIAWRNGLDRRRRRCSKARARRCSKSGYGHLSR